MPPNDPAPFELPGLIQQVLELLRQGHYLQAIVPARRAVDLARHVLGEQHPIYAAMLSNLGNALRMTGDFRAAEPLMRQACEIQRTVHGPQHPQYATALEQLAGVYSGLRDYAPAEPCAGRL